MTTLDCMRCHSPMEKGFLADASHGGVYQARWCRGEASPNWFGAEVKMQQFESAVTTVSYRCPKCGLLESYAPDPKKH